MFRGDQSKLVHIHIFHRPRNCADVAWMRGFDQNDFEIR
jgi:hypothetical protein